MAGFNFFRQVSITGSFAILSMFAGLVFSIISARFLGPEGKGLYVGALLIPNLIAVLFALGVPSATTYFISTGRHQPQETLHAVLPFSFVAGLLGVLCSASILYIFGDRESSSITLIYSLMASCIVLPRILRQNLVALSSGMKRFFANNFILLLEQVLMILSFTILYYFANLQVIWCLVLAVIVAMIGALISLLLIPKPVRKGAKQSPENYFKDVFRYGGQIYVGSIISLFNYKVGLYLIGYYDSPINLGIFSVAQGTAELIWLIPNAMGVVFFPYLGGLSADNRATKTQQVGRVTFQVSVVCCTALWFFAPWLVELLYSSDFLDAIAPIRWMLVGVAFFSLGKVLSSYMAIEGLLGVGIVINFLSITINIGLGYFLLQKIGIVGVAISLSVAYTFDCMSRCGVFARTSGLPVRSLFVVKFSDYLYMYKVLIEKCLNLRERS